LKGEALTKNDFFVLVAGVLAVPADSLSLESTPDQIPSWDSLAQVTMCMALEQTLHIKLTMTDMLSIKSLSDFVDVLGKHSVTLD
jgi:acyl carrier protein